MGFAGDQPNRDALDLAPTGSAPANAVQGTIIYHTTSGLIYYTGSVWKSTNSTTLGEIGNVNTSILGNEQIIVWDNGNSEWKPSGLYLNYLQDVSTGTPTLEDSLVWNGSAWTASGVTGGGGASALNDLSDVDTTGLATDEALVYDGASWVPAPMDLNTNVAGDLGQLDDVSTTGLGDASGLAYNQGSKTWEPKNFNLGHHVTGSLDDLDDVSLTAPASGELLKYDGSNWVNTTSSAPSGYVWTVISSGTQINGTSLPVVTFNGSGYEEIKYKITNLDVGADTFFKMTMQDSGGSDIDSDYQYAHMAGATDGANPGTDSSTSSTDGVLHYATSLIDVNSNGQSAFEFTIQNPTDSAGSSDELSVICQGGFYRTDGKHMTTQGTLIYDGATTAHGFKIETGVNSANISCNYQCLALVPMANAIFDASPTAMNDLTDVSAASPTSGDLLRYDGSNWANTSLTFPSVYVWKEIDSAELTSSTQEISVSGMFFETSAIEFKAEFSSIELDSTDDLAVRIGTTIAIQTASLYDWSSISIQDGSSSSVRVNSDNQAHVTSQGPAAVGTGKNTAVTVIYKNPDRATGSHPVFETWATSPDGNDTSQATHMGSFTYASDLSLLDEIQLTVDVDASATMASGVTAKLYALVPMSDAIVWA